MLNFWRVLGWISTHFPLIWSSWTLRTPWTPQLQDPFSLPFWRSLAPTTVSVSCCTLWVSIFIYKRNRFLKQINHSSNLQSALAFGLILKKETLYHWHMLTSYITSLVLKQYESRINRTQTVDLHSNPRTWRSCRTWRTWSTPAIIWNGKLNMQSFVLKPS